MTTRLQAVHVAVTDLDRATMVYQAILGSNAEQVGSTSVLRAGPTSLVLSARGADGAGITGVDLVVDSLADRAQALAELGRRYTAGLGRITVGLHGLEVRLGEGPLAATTDHRSTAAVDHVALRVSDIEEAGLLWEAATGATAESMGLHPVSAGAFSATRLHLGTQMIELISPTPGVDSAVAQRLASHGEGPTALALPSSALDDTRHALEALEVRVLRRDPHWMVHPADAGGVLVQLTPRVEH